MKQEENWLTLEEMLKFSDYVRKNGSWKRHRVDDENRTGEYSQTFYVGKIPYFETYLWRRDSGYEISVMATSTGEILGAYEGEDIRVKKEYEKVLDRVVRRRCLDTKDYLTLARKIINH